MFVLLVAPPGVGKSVAIREAVNLWHKTKKMKVAPDDITKASLIDAMEGSHQIHLYSATDMIEYHSLAVGADELGVLLPAHDLAFLNTLNVLYDNRPNYKETRRHRDNDINLINPQMNLLAGTQPDYMATLLPPEAWGMGFMTRILMIYHGKPSKPKLFGKRISVNTKDLEWDLTTICELHGEMRFTQEAEDFLSEWYDRDLAPVPEHPKLKHYIARRVLHVLKLAMISSVSRDNSLVIERWDVERAQEWLIEAEGLMPEVFKDMNGTSDVQVIQDLHYYLWEVWNKSGKKPIHRARVDMFLMERTPAYNAENIVRLCISAGILVPQDPDNQTFVPGDRNKTKWEN